MKTLRTSRWLLALLLPFALLAAACGDDDDGGDDAAETGDDAGTDEEGAEGGGACSDATAPDGAPQITIGAQDFGESAILAEVYAQCLQAAGYSVSVEPLGGFRDLELAAFEGGDINFAPEYAASMLENLNADATEATNDAVETTALLEGYLDDLDLVALEPSDAVDTNNFVVTQDTAGELGIATLSDLADHTDLTLGAPADCETNPFCLPGLGRVYGFELANFTPLESGAIGAALNEGAVDIAIIFSTDSRLATEDWVVLEDDEGMLAADNVLPVVTTEVSEVEGLADLADAVSAELTTDILVELNERFDVDREDADAIAGDFLEEAGLV
ncbi:MAG: ABC transporter substrate-binding protein [Acidimicrobiales bacterium]